MEVAVQEVVNSGSFEEQIHKQIMSSVEQWRTKYSAYLEAGKYYEQI